VSPIVEQVLNKELRERIKNINIIKPNFRTENDDKNSITTGK
jgi:hypothetical protein